MRLARGPGQRCDGGSQDEIVFGEHALQALRHDEEPPISAVDGYHAVEIAEACYESASAKEPVEIESDDDDDSPDDWDEC